MSATERITVECPRCGATYDVWPQSAPVLALDPELGDPGWIQSHAAATCPECGKSSCCGGLLSADLDH
jgi:endogenous inhibitor of DNA gyrase (YacG/DUF329 family)